MTSVEEYKTMQHKIMGYGIHKQQDGQWKYSASISGPDPFDACYNVLFGKYSFRSRSYPYQLRKIDQHLPDGDNLKRGKFILGLNGHKLSSEEVEYVTCIGGIVRISQLILDITKERIKCQQKKESPSLPFVTVLQVLQERLLYLSHRLKTCLQDLSLQKKQSLSIRLVGMSCLDVLCTSDMPLQVTSTCLPIRPKRLKRRKLPKTIYFY